MASADKAKVLRRRVKRPEAYLHANTIAAACTKFLKSRGLTSERDIFNRNPTAEKDEK